MNFEKSETADMTENGNFYAYKRVPFQLTFSDFSKSKISSIILKNRARNFTTTILESAYSAVLDMLDKLRTPSLRL